MTLFRSLVLLSMLGWVYAGAAESEADWEPYAQRPALMPEVSRSTGDGILVIEATGRGHVDGGWRRSIPVTGGRHYRFSAEYRAVGVENERRSVLARIDWLDTSGKRVDQPEFPMAELVDHDGGRALFAVRRAPEGASAAVVDLVLRWSETGRVEWRDIVLEEVEAPEPRPVKVATIHYRPVGSSGPDENRKLFGQFLDQAGEAGADLALLPEGMTMVGTSLRYLDVAEPVPGTTTRYLADYARRHRMWVAAGIVEREGEVAYNTAVLMDREGRLAGKYRKVSLPREEIEGGLTPGSEFPVFQTDFGRIGLLICWDIQFPEGARRLAAQGAEVILLPIWGGIELLYPARAVENQVFLVTSSYDSTTGVWNRRGEVVAEAPKSGGLAVATIDLAEVTRWEWLGDLRSRIPRESPPD